MYVHVNAMRKNKNFIYGPILASELKIKLVTVFVEFIKTIIWENIILCKMQPCHSQMYIVNGLMVLLRERESYSSEMVTVQFPLKHKFKTSTTF